MNEINRKNLPDIKELNKQNKIIGFVICFLLLIVILIYTFDLIPAEYDSLTFYWNIFIFFICFYYVVLIHEFTHFIVFKINKIKMRGLFLTIFFFIKDNNKWHLKIHPNSITAFGGIAIPDIPAINNQKDFDNIRKVLSKTIIAGPVFSILLVPITTILILPVYFLDLSPYYKSFFFLFNICLVAITIILIMASYIKSDIAVGDFSGYQLVKNDEYFLTTQLSHYFLYSSDSINKINSSKFLFDKLEEILQKEYSEKSSHTYTLSNIYLYITNYLSNKINSLPEIVIKYIYYYSENPYILIHHTNFEISISLYFRIVCYLSIIPSKKTTALSLYKMILHNVNISDKVVKYYIAQAEQFLGLFDNKDFLEYKKNICTSLTCSLWSGFSEYYDTENNINDRAYKNNPYKVR